MDRNHKSKNVFGLEQKKDLYEQLKNQEIRINVYGAPYVGILKEYDSENIYLSPHMVVEPVPNDYGGKLVYKIEKNYALPIPKNAICAPEKLSKGYIEKYVSLGNEKENELEKKLKKEEQRLKKKSDTEKIYNQLKRKKSDVRVNISDGECKLGNILKIKDGYIYLQPYIIYEEFCDGKEFVQAPRLETEIPLPIPKHLVINIEKLQDGYINYFLQTCVRYKVKNENNKTEK